MDKEKTVKHCGGINIPSFEEEKETEYISPPPEGSTLDGYDVVFAMNENGEIVEERVRKEEGNNGD